MLDENEYGGHGGMNPEILGENTAAVPLGPLQIHQNHLGLKT